MLMAWVYLLPVTFLVDWVDILKKEHLLWYGESAVVVGDKSIETFPNGRVVDLVDSAEGEEKTKLTEVFEEVDLLRAFED